MTDDDLVVRIKRTSDHLEKVHKVAAVRKRVENGLRASRPR
jgi:hypothetical protein